MFGMEFTPEDKKNALGIIFLAFIKERYEIRQEERNED